MASTGSLLGSPTRWSNWRAAAIVLASRWYTRRATDTSESCRCSRNGLLKHKEAKNAAHNKKFKLHAESEFCSGETKWHTSLKLKLVELFVNRITLESTDHFLGWSRAYAPASPLTYHCCVFSYRTIVLRLARAALWLTVVVYFPTVL